jgi:hypothetical protein
VGLQSPSGIQRVNHGSGVLIELVSRTWEGSECWLCDPATEHLTLFPIWRDGSPAHRANYHSIERRETVVLYLFPDLALDAPDSGAGVPP